MSKRPSRPAAPGTTPATDDAASRDAAPEAAGFDGTMDERFADRVEMMLPVRHNPTLAKILERVNAGSDFRGVATLGCSE